MIKYSILIPVYNVQRYLSECLDSVLAQTFSDFEAIVIDDGSDDGSGEICDVYAEKDKRIKVYHQKNQGLMQTRKNGVQKARGQYCLFLDSDDYYAPELLECVDEFLNKNVCDIVIYNTISVYDGKCIKAAQLSEGDTVWSCEDAFAQLFSGSQLFSIFMKVIKTQLIQDRLEEVYIPVNYAEDLLQTVHFFAAAESIGVLNQHLYYYRMRRGSLIHTTSIEKIKEVLHVSQLVLELIEKQGFATEENKRNFQRFVLNDFMENVYKLNNVPMSMAEHKEQLKQAANLSGYCSLNTKGNQSRIVFYNSIRMYLLNAERYMELIMGDRILHFVQILWQRLKRKKKFT